MSDHAAIFQAIDDDDLESFQTLLAETNPDARRGDDGPTLLFAAAGAKRAEMVRLLLAAGAEVDHRQSGKRTPLHNAAWHFDADVVEQLLEAGADLEATDRFGWTPIFLADKWEEFSMFLDRGARVDVVADDGETLVRRMATSNAFSAQEDGVKILEKLVELGTVIADEPLDRHGHTLLMEVIERAKEKHNIIAHFLIEHGMDPLAASPVGVTALHYACKSANLDMVKTLLDLGADPNATVTEEWYAFEDGARPVDMMESYYTDFGAIKAALEAGGLERREVPIKNPIVRNRIVIVVDSESPEAAIDEMLEITADIKGNVFKHPDYTNGDERLAYRFDDEAMEDGLDEFQFFMWCAEEASLRPKIVQYIRQIIAFNDAGYEPVYVHSEQEAGGHAMESLLRTKDAQYLPLFVDYLASIDVDHTVHLYDLMDTVRETFTEEQLEAVNEQLEEDGFDG